MRFAKIKAATDQNPAVEKWICGGQRQANPVAVPARVLVNNLGFDNSRNRRTTIRSTSGKEDGSKDSLYSGL